jgi:integrase
MAGLDSRQNAKVARRGLELIASKVDGTPAKPNTFNRRRAVFYNVLKFAVEQGQLDSNPLDFVSYKVPKAVETVDSRSVVNMAQARLLLEAVAAQGKMGERLVAFFAVMLYAALRPAEALGLRRPHLKFMPTDGGWGEILLARSTPRSGTAWTDSGQSREERGLKHRADEDTRPVPAYPELVTILNSHVEEFGYGPGGRLISGPRGGRIDESTYLRIWQDARQAVLTPDELASPLAARPYDLRHTAVSTWLNAGVPPTQVAEWAGHSVAVLLRVYAKCIVGQDVAARARIEEALREPDQEKPADS